MPVDPEAPVTGTSNAETLQGTEGADTLLGLGGDDSLIGDEGDDSLVGGDGNDTLRGGHGDDTLEGGDGDDEIEGLYGNDVIDTGAGNDHVFGRDGDDLIYGRSGDDHLIGSMGTDTVYGGAGNDTLAGSQGNDEIYGGAGNDLAFIGTFEDSDRIFMGAGNDIVDGAFAGSSFYAEGGTGNDTMSAGVGDDTLFGGLGNDLLSGGSGDDLLSAGGDSDTVSGGEGADVFLVQDVPGSLLITDFGANGAADLIDLSELTGYGNAAAVSAAMTFGPYQSTLNLDVTGGPLVITIHHETPLTAADLGLSGTLTGTETGEGPDAFGGTPDDSGGGPQDGPDDATSDTFSLAGPDAGYFLVDPEDGTISNIEWFTPQYSQVWDANGDRIYEVSLLERDENGEEINRSDLELVVSQGGAVWRDVQSGDTLGEETVFAGGDTDTLDGTGGQDTLDGGGTPDPDPGDGTTYTLAGPDAAVFVVDPTSGDLSYQNWFTPNYEDVWDTDRDHVYEVSVIGTDAQGAEISQQHFELVVTETDAIWQEGTPQEDPGDGPDGGETEGEGPSEDTFAGENAAGATYALAGDDASIFVIDPDTGDVSYQTWFTPRYEDVWDADRDHVYEVSVIGTDANGDTVSQQDIELAVSETEAVWRIAVPGDDPEEGDGTDPTGDTDSGDIFPGPDAAGVTYALAGADAGVFEIDPDSGDVSYRNWFTPNYDEVWDMDRDHIYEVSVIGTDANGAAVSQLDLELVVSETDAVWQQAGDDPTGPVDPVEPVDPVATAPYLNGAADQDLLNLFDAAADLYIDDRGNSNAPIFDGSIDWHSSVHGHLANVAAYEANGDQAGLQAFADSRFTAEDVQAEIDLNFNDPYGWAWLLKLDTKLQDNGINHLAPAGEHFANELEQNLSQQIANGGSDSGAGSYNDANWKIANLIQYAQHQGDTAAEARYLQMFEDIQADTNVTGDTSVADGDFFSALSLSAYAHVVAGATDTPLYQDIHDQLLQSVTDGSLDALLDTEGARLDAGIGFSHSAGIAISSAYGYWAMFAQTENPAFYEAYANVVEWTETYAPEMAESIAPGHWLPNFSSFAVDLPAQIIVDDPDGTLTAQIAAWQAETDGPAVPEDPADPSEPEDPADPDTPTEPEATDQELIGGSGADALTGGAGDDLLDGQGGKDTLDGGAGDDTLMAGFDDGTGDVFIGGAGTDTYDIGNSAVSTFAFNVDLASGLDQYGNSYSGIENILGGSGNDTLRGDDQDNLFAAGAGDDLLHASAGDDTLDGGAGDDVFAVTAEVGALQINGFGQGTEADRIDVSALEPHFASAEDLMAALSFADGEARFNVDLETGSRLVTIEAEEALDEEDFIF